MRKVETESKIETKVNLVPYPLLLLYSDRVAGYNAIQFLTTLQMDAIWA